MPDRGTIRKPPDPPANARRARQSVPPAGPARRRRRRPVATAIGPAQHPTTTGSASGSHRRTGRAAPRSSAAARDRAARPATGNPAPAGTARPSVDRARRAPMPTTTRTRMRAGAAGQPPAATGRGRVGRVRTMPIRDLARRDRSVPTKPGRGRVDPDRTARRSRDRNGPIRTTLIAPGGDRARPATVARHGPPTASTTTAGHGIGRRTVGSPDRTDRVRTRRTGPATGSRGRRSGPRPSVPGWRGPTGSTRRGSRRRSTSTSTPASTRIGTGSGLAPDRDDRPRSSPGSLLRSSVPGVPRGAWPESALGQRHIRPTSLAESAVRSGWPGPTPDHGAPAHYLDVSTTEVAGTAGPLVSPGTRSAERGFHRQRRAADPGRPRAEDHDLRRLAAEMCVISRPRRSQAASLPRSVTARR